MAQELTVRLISVQEGTKCKKFVGTLRIHCLHFKSLNSPYILMFTTSHGVFAALTLIALVIFHMYRANVDSHVDRSRGLFGQNFIVCHSHFNSPYFY